MVGAEEEAKESKKEGGKDVVARQEANHKACDFDLLACVVYSISVRVTLFNLRTC